MNRNLKTLFPKLSLYRKRIFSLCGGAGVIAFSLLLYFRFCSPQTLSLPSPTPEEKAPAPTKEEITAETNQLIDYQQVNQYFCRIVKEI